MPTNTPDPAIIKLENVRLSFPHLFTPHAMEEGKEPKFEATFLLDVGEHAALIKKIEVITERVALDMFKRKVPLKHRSLRDGNDKSELEGYGDGVMFVCARSLRRPPVIDRNKSPITEADGLIYAGCYVNASIRVFAYEHKTGGRGVSTELRWVQFVRDGESFGAGKVDVDAEADELGDDPMMQ